MTELIIALVDKDSDEFKRGEIAFELIKRNYDAEMARVNDLDGKAGTQIGFISVVLSLLIGVGTFQLLEKLTLPQFFLPYLIGIGLLLLSFLSSLFAIKIRDWTWAPKTQTVFDGGFKSENGAWFVMLMASKAMVIAVEDMKKKNNDKASKISMSWQFLIGGLGAIIVYVLVVALSGIDADTVINVRDMIVGNMTVL